MHNFFTELLPTDFFVNLRNIVCISQVRRDALERSVLVSRFTTEADLFREMDYVAGTSGAQEYSRKAIVAFLRSKNWVIQESAEPVCIIYMRGGRTFFYAETFTTSLLLGGCELILCLLQLQFRVRIRVSA